MKSTSKFSFYNDGINQTKPTKDIEMKDFLKMLDNPNINLMGAFMSIRNETNKEKRNKTKSKLPYVTFAGTFINRSKNGLREASGFVCQDYDGIEGEELKRIKKELIKDKFAHLVFISPSGKGLKVIAKIPKVKNDAEYKEYWNSIAKHYDLDCNDEANKDVSRACYVSLDSEYYFNEDSEIYTEREKPKEYPKTKPTEFNSRPTQSETPKDSCAFMDYCLSHEIPKGDRHRVISRNMSIYIYRHPDKELLKKQYVKIQKGSETELNQWLASLDKSNEDYPFSCGELINFQKKYKIPLKCRGCQKFLDYKEKVEDKPIEKDSLEIKTLPDYRKLKKNKNFIVDGFLYPESSIMLYSPPAKFKSLIALDIGFAVATGKEFLGLPTKKQAVLYCDGENSDMIVKDRIEKFHKGRNLRRWKIPLYFLSNGVLIDEKKKVHMGFVEALKDTIEKYNIKLIIFDTMHRFAFYDENKSDDINLLYTKIFRPLILKYKLSIMFLHHSKKDGGYRGSGDFLGMVDVSYKICRNEKSDKFNIVNEKCRSGEIADLGGEIFFGENRIKISPIDLDEENEDKINKLKQLTDEVKKLFEIGTELTKKDVETNLEINEVEYARATLFRVLKFLVDNDFLDKFEKGKYRRIK